MKLPANKVESTIKALPKEALAVLLYGPDQGKVQLHAKTIIKTHLPDPPDPLAFVEFSATELKDDESRFHSELQNFTLGVERKILKLHFDGTSISASLKEAFNHVSHDHLVVMTANELPPSSTLRQFAEKSSHILALPCYADDERTSRAFLNEQANTLGLTLDPGVDAALFRYAGEDRMMLTQELEKLSLCLFPSTHIRLEDVERIIASSNQSHLDQLCQHVFHGKIRQAMHVIEQLTLQGEHPITMIRVLMRYIQRLLLVKHQCNAGTQDDEAIKNLRPPIFFKQLPAFKDHLYRLSLEQLEHIFFALMRAETYYKTSTVSEPTTFMQYCSIVASVCVAPKERKALLRLLP